MNKENIIAWLEDQINIKNNKVIIISLNGKYATQEDLLQKRLREFSYFSGNEIMTIDEFTE